MVINKETFYPIFDILPRLWSEGYTISQEMEGDGGRWWLFDKKGEGVISGETFKDLCVNIILAGI